MGIEKLRHSLLSEAKEEADEIIQSAEAQAGRMLQEEEAKREAMKASAEQEVEDMLDGQRNERIAWARLEAKRIGAEAREDAINSVMDSFFDTLAKARGSAEYKKFLKGAIAEAASDLGGKVVIHVVKGEKALSPKIKGAKIVDDLDALGGAVVETSDGRIRVDLTMETLVDTRRDEIRKKIADRLFGEK